MTIAELLDALKAAHAESGDQYLAVLSRETGGCYLSADAAEFQRSLVHGHEAPAPDTTATVWGVPVVDVRLGNVKGPGWHLDGIVLVVVERFPGPPTDRTRLH